MAATPKKMCRKWRAASPAGDCGPLQGEFGFDPRRHDEGEKRVLGMTLPPGGGESDGERVLDLIAEHPATAHHIAYKLCQRFIADEPPASAVDRAAAVFQSTHGDLRAVVKFIVTSEEFSAPAARRGKIKSPFELAVSSVRILGATPALAEPSGFEKVRWTMEGAGHARLWRGGHGQPAAKVAQLAHSRSRAAALRFHRARLGGRKIRASGSAPAP